MRSQKVATTQNFSVDSHPPYTIRCARVMLFADSIGVSMGMPERSGVEHTRTHKKEVEAFSEEGS